MVVIEMILWGCVGVLFVRLLVQKHPQDHKHYAEPESEKEEVTKDD